jgi:hypothetical protein
MEKHTLVWIPVGPERPIPLPSEKIFRPDKEQNFPIHLSGEECDKFETSGEFSVSTLGLLAGALLGCRDRPHIPIVDPRPLLSAYLKKFAKESDTDLESLVIHVVGLLRKKNGNELSSKALMNYYDTFHSKHIMNDLLLDLWSCLNKVDDGKFNEQFLLFYRYARDVDINKLRVESVEWYNWAWAITLVYFDIKKIKHEYSTTEAISKVNNERCRDDISSVLRNKVFERKIMWGLYIGERPDVVYNS